VLFVFHVDFFVRNHYYNCAALVIKLYVNQPSPVTNDCGFAVAASLCKPMPSENGSKETTLSCLIRKLFAPPEK